MNDDPTGGARDYTGGWISGGCAPVPGAYDGGMDDLIAFLNARLDEDEAAAKACPAKDWEAIGPPRTGVYVGTAKWHLTGRVAADRSYLLAEGIDYHDPAHASLEHAARHDPARVLREAAAKRAIVTRYETACRQAGVAAVNGDAAEQEAWEKIAGALELDVRSLAAVCSDHPDYRAGWKP